MSLHTQKYLRLLIPGILLYGLLVIFCWTTRWCNLPIPQTWEEITKLLVAVLLGVLYHFTGLREISNGCYYIDVTSNIVEKLTNPFAREIPLTRRLTWNDLRSTFYNFIDNDESLKVQSDIIRFNGLLWTSIADLRAVTIIAVLFFAGSMVCSSQIQHLKFPEYRAGLPISVLTVIFLSTFWFSRIATARHKDLSAGQCEHILEHHGAALKARLEQISDRLERAS